MEATAPETRGVAVAWRLASQHIAAPEGALIGLVLSATLSAEALESYGWRIAFLFGALVPIRLSEGRAQPNQWLPRNAFAKSQSMK
jgi:MFS family permease